MLEEKPPADSSWTWVILAVLLGLGGVLLNPMLREAWKFLERYVQGTH